MFCWIAVDSDFDIYSVSGFRSYFEAECDLSAFLDVTDVNIMNSIVREM